MLNRPVVQHVLEVIFLNNFADPTLFALRARAIQNVESTSDYIAQSLIQWQWHAMADVCIHKQTLLRTARNEKKTERLPKKRISSNFQYLVEF